MNPDVKIACICSGSPGDPDYTRARECEVHKPATFTPDVATVVQLSAALETAQRDERATEHLLAKKHEATCRAVEELTQYLAGK